jgi:fructose-1,6-bisphosphatase/sedoheptulose 1,7-bisphosphatase-like protein
VHRTARSGLPAEENARLVVKGGAVEDVTVCILDRPRHDALVAEVREAGARIKFIINGDMAGAIMAAREGTGVDLMMGIGGTPRGQYRSGGAQTQSIVMRSKSGTIRLIDSYHKLSKLRAYSAIDFDRPHPHPHH